MRSAVAQKHGQKNPPGARQAPKAGQTKPRAGAGNQLRQREAELHPSEQEERESTTPSAPRATGLLLQRKCACHGSGGSCAKCKKKDQDVPLLRRATMEAPRTIPSIVRSVLAKTGRPLDPAVRAAMERQFGSDFGDVRIHDDESAAESARAVSALAYTVGQDIVFDRGRYAPHTAEGFKLLAHELAHTIQQRGFERSATSAVMPSPIEERRLDAEADRAADRALAANLVAPPVLSAELPSLSRVPRRWAGTRTTEFTVPITWPQLAGDLVFHVTARANDPEVHGVAFLIDAFYLPVNKRFALGRYEARAQSGALEAHISWESGHPRAVSQGEDGTPRLIDLWLQRVNWPVAQRHLLWHLAGGAPGPASAPAAGTAPPTTATATATATPNDFNKVAGAAGSCSVDHITELQLGGNNVPDNMFMLDLDWNTEAGIRFIAPLVKGLGSRIRNEYYPEAADRPVEMILSFRNNIEVRGNPAQTGVPPVNPETYDRNRCLREVFGGRATQCWQVELCSRHLLPAEIASTGAVVTAPAGRLYPLRFGESTVTIAATRPTATPLVIAPTDPVSDLISGLQILRVTLRPDASRRRGAFDLVEAAIDRRTRAGRPRTSAPSLDALDAALTADGATIRINRAPDRTATEPAEAGATEGRLTLVNRRPALRFRYPGMSDISMTLSLDQNNRIIGRGTLTPGVPLLNRLPMNVEFGEGRLRAFYGTMPRGGRPVPGGRVTEMSLGAELMPEFHPSGRVVIELGPARKPLGNIVVEASADENGLALTGDVSVQIPGTDRAEGHVEYRNHAWSGFVVVESSKISLPGFQRGELRVDFNPDGSIRPSGAVDLLILGNPVELRASYQNQRLLLTGDARIRVPNLEPVVVSLRHDGEHLTGSARTGVTIAGITGNVTVNYRDGRVSGEGTMSVSRGRASGNITLRIGDRGDLTGRGSVTVRLTDNLIGTVAIEKPEREPVRVSGELAFPNPIRLFGPVDRSHTLFQRTVEFGIPGLSIPVVNVGVVATLTGRLGVSYGFGPGTMTDVRVGVGFNPLEDNTDFAVDATARMNVPAYANLSLSVRAGAGLSAGVASITGGITGTGTVGLRGGFTGAIEFHYRNAVYSIGAEAAIRMRPVFRLGLDADLTAEVGAWGYVAARWQKVWNLAGFEWGANAEAGLIANLRYASNEGLTLPSAENIQWIVPQIDVGSIVGDLFNRARSSEHDLD